MPSFGQIVAGLIALAVLALVGVGGFLWWQSRSAQHVAVAAQQQAGKATVAAGQAQAQTNAVQVVVAGQARDTLDIEVHQHNDQAIAAAPGASSALDARLNRAGIAGLCQHPAYAADPGCAGLRGADPAVVPAAGSGNAASAP